MAEVPADGVWAETEGSVAGSAAPAPAEGAGPEALGPPVSPLRPFRCFFCGAPAARRAGFSPSFGPGARCSLCAQLELLLLEVELVGRTLSTEARRRLTDEVRALRGRVNRAHPGLVADP